MVEEETFFAWLDGELPPDEAARVEAAVAADPELARKAAEHRALEMNLKRAFDTIGAAAVPPRMIVAAMPERSNIVSIAEAREAGERPPRMALWKQAAALAATLAVGIFTGNMLAPGEDGPIQAEAGRLVAGGELEQALYTRLASAPSTEGPRIGITYRDKSGAICRTFEEDRASGLACREGGDWRIRGLFQGPEGQGGDYRMAAGADPRLMDLVDETISGDPFDSAQEKAVRDRNWR